MEIVVNQDSLIAQGVRLIRRLYKVDADADFPTGFKFALQYLFLGDGMWIEVTRIDNYRHDKRRTGTHIHKLGRTEVEYREMDFKEAEEYVISLGDRLKLALLLKGGKNGVN